MAPSGLGCYPNTRLCILLQCRGAEGALECLRKDHAGQGVRFSRFDMDDSNSQSEIGGAMDHRGHGITEMQSQEILELSSARDRDADDAEAPVIQAAASLILEDLLESEPSSSSSCTASFSGAKVENGLRVAALDSSAPCPLPTADISEQSVSSMDATSWFLDSYADCENQKCNAQQQEPFCETPIEVNEAMKNKSSAQNTSIEVTTNESRGMVIDDLATSRPESSITRYISRNTKPNEQQRLGSLQILDTEPLDATTAISEQFGGDTPNQSLQERTPDLYLHNSTIRTNSLRPQVMQSAAIDDDDDNDDDVLSVASLTSIYRERNSFSSSFSDVNAEDLRATDPDYGTVSPSVIHQQRHMLDSAESGLSGASSTSQSVFICGNQGPDLPKQLYDFKLNLMSDDDESSDDEEPLRLDYQDVEDDIGSEMSICL